MDRTQAIVLACARSARHNCQVPALELYPFRFRLHWNIGSGHVASSDSHHETRSPVSYRRLGPGPPRTWTPQMFLRAFTASTFRGFWQYWNPLYGYGLTYFCYSPLRRIAPKAVSFVATFALSGFLLHDLLFCFVDGLPARHWFPIVTVAFVCLALVCLLCERVGVTLNGLSPVLRAASHVGVILVAFAVSVGVSVLLSRRVG